jgi:hypothetical protein
MLREDAAEDVPCLEELLCATVDGCECCRCQHVLTCCEQCIERHDVQCLPFYA